MARKKLLFFIPLVLLILSLVYLFNRFNPFLGKPAGLIVNTNVPSQVFFDKNKLGETPYTNDHLSPGEHLLILKPLNQNAKPSSWQTKVHLYRGSAASVHYNFATSLASSSAYIVQPEPNSDPHQTTISLISDPDIVNVSIDNQAQGFAPLKKTPLKPGQHQLKLSASGFQPLSFSISAPAGYNLMIQAKLAQSLLTIEPDFQATASATSSASTKTSSASASAPTKPYVVIKPTGTGWLRVRKQPSTSAEELGKVDVGQKLKFIKVNEVGWYKVIFKGQEAWISGRYAQLYR